MLKRKIETYLADWKQSKDRKPLVIKGIYQCGKTYIVQKFARENYDSVVYMNFILEPDKKSAMELLYRYVIVGGLPEVVNCFLETKNIELIYKLQRNLIAEYEEDMVKYVDDADKPNIRECFESIPKQLAKENKKFQYSVVKKGGRSSQYIGSIQWLEDAGIVRRCYNIQTTELR